MVRTGRSLLVILRYAETNGAVMLNDRQRHGSQENDPLDPGGADQEGTGEPEHQGRGLARLSVGLLSSSHLPPPPCRSTARWSTTNLELRSSGLILPAQPLVCSLLLHDQQAGPTGLAEGARERTPRTRGCMERF
mmetsp:Transcript_16691/g.55577  ORF Transcript_16691/g.55577 Transcript_16691/m.55577 type:complete len:135 (+) Transcript_16691:1443-1847(+)